MWDGSDTLVAVVGENELCLEDGTSFEGLWELLDMRFWPVRVG